MHPRPIQRDAGMEMTDFDHGGRIPQYMFHLTYTDFEIIYIFIYIYMYTHTHTHTHTHGGKYILVVKYPSAHGVMKSWTRLSD